MMIDGPLDEIVDVEYQSPVGRVESPSRRRQLERLRGALKNLQQNMIKFT